MAYFSAKRFLTYFSILTFVSAVVMVFALKTVNPYSASFGAFVVVYLALFLFSLSLFTLLGYSLRVFLSHNHPLYSFARVSLRQGFFLTVLFVVLLFLQSLRSLSLLSIGLLALSLALLEMALLAR